MKKLILISISIILLTACSGTPPQPSEPKGDWKQINDPQYYKDNGKLEKDK
ncbi:hypothetical protein H3S74_12205 [Gilliamella sp. W8126]|uniref:hypothetical protein n=1 Tax=Gilliamella sp. W8126 TaxID=2750946 RepID=UPI0018DE19C1|nr:hypothetical protein [Gilliamella sp. W8126]MBI0006992.1 hypothetical protein [Gilliamella sp. W8126]